MKPEGNAKESTGHSKPSASPTTSSASPRASADTSLPYRLTASEIESLRKDLQDTMKELDGLFADVKPFPRQNQG